MGFLPCIFSAVERKGTASHQRLGRGFPASPPVPGLGAGCIPKPVCSFRGCLEAAALTTEPGAPIPAAPAGDGAGRAQPRACPFPSCPMEYGCGLGVIQGSGMAGRNLVHGCKQASDRHGVVHSVLAQEEGCCLGEARRGWRGSGTPVLPSLLGLSWFSSSVLGFDRVSLSLHISPSLLRIPGCVYRSARAASKQEPPWAAARRGVPTPTTTRVPSTQVSPATGMGLGVLGTLTHLSVGPTAPGSGACGLLACQDGDAHCAGSTGKCHKLVWPQLSPSHKCCGWWVAVGWGDTAFPSLRGSCLAVQAVP